MVEEQALAPAVARGVDIASLAALSAAVAACGGKVAKHGNRSITSAWTRGGAGGSASQSRSARRPASVMAYSCRRRVGPAAAWLMVISPSSASRFGSA